ncbi:MAG: hypothetical protein HQ549_00370 [Candidatus Omnitrophica bacterium]|nr:hypothetical protein [Candidatus Omnitrophota bacterium]
MNGRMTIKVIVLVICLGIVVSQSPCLAEKGKANAYKDKELKEIPSRSVKQFKEVLETKKELIVKKEIGDNIELPEKGFEIIKYPNKDIGSDPVRGLAPKPGLENPIARIIELPREPLIPKKEYEKYPVDLKFPNMDIREYLPIDPSEIDGYPEYNYKDGRLVQLIVYNQPHLPQPGEPLDKGEMWYEDAWLVQTIVYHDPKPYMVNFFSSDLEASRNTGCTIAVTTKITETPAQSETETEKPELDEGSLKLIANRIQKNRASMLQFINGKDEDIE